MPDLAVDVHLIDDIAAQLDLREPNRDALEAIAVAERIHYEHRKAPPPFEGVVDVATGVGKTYVMAGAMEYFAALGHRHFAVITPGSTILNKTVRNFSHGDAKSLLGGMSIRPELITAETFDSPMVAAQMENEETVKIYIFTVQSLIRPTTKQGRRTHEFREAMGDAFYEKLASEEDLIVFADEHHTYYGPAFSRAIRGLHPYALIGLTATPHPKTPAEQVIFRYPLAAAIADRYVKTPVIVGRKDDRDDDRTKLADGARLLEMKSEAVRRYADETGSRVVNPVMLVVAQTIGEAEEYAALLESAGFLDGRFKGKVLTVHSDQSDAALADLDKVEHPRSPVRIIVSVGMLKEGWDVKNVYVIASMRASVSDILTEQTLGRGLRLPFGSYTGIEMLDTLEVVAHESYQALLKRAKVLKEEFVDSRTLIDREQARAEGTVSSQEVRPTVTVSSADAEPGEGTRPGFSLAEDGGPGGLTISSVEERTAAVESQLEGLTTEIEAYAGRPDLKIPIIRMTPIKAEFSLADIEPKAFKELGERHAADPDQFLVRTVVSAQMVRERREVELVTHSAEDPVHASAEAIPLHVSLRKVKKAIAKADEVPARGAELGYLDKLVDAYVEGLGDKAQEVLAAYPERAVASFRRLLREEQRKFEAKPQFDETIRVEALSRTRSGRSETSRDLAGQFWRGVGYEGWKRSYFPQVWFDSDPEFRFARTVDDAAGVEFWVRLVRNDIPIMYTSGANHYNPDFVVVLGDGTHVLTEVKAESAVSTEQVQRKKEAAGRWARRASQEMEGDWEYLLVTDRDVRECKGAWAVLRATAR
jgi:type III restriction enzyme